MLNLTQNSTPRVQMTSTTVVVFQQKPTPAINYSGEKIKRTLNKIMLYQKIKSKKSGTSYPLCGDVECRLLVRSDIKYSIREQKSSPRKTRLMKPKYSSSLNIKFAQWRYESCRVGGK